MQTSRLGSGHYYCRREIFNTDNTDWTQGGQQTHLVTGQSVTLISNDPTKCVKQVQTFVQVTFPDGSSTVLQAVANRASQSVCLIEDKLTVQPASSIPESALKTLRKTDIIVLARD